MRLNILILLITIVAGFALTLWFDHSDKQPSEPPAPPPVVATTGLLVPPFTLTDLKGKQHSIAETQGHATIIHFWATWCAPCIVEFPQLLDFATKHPNIRVFALSSDTNDANIARFLKKQKPLPANIVIARDPHQKITADLFQTFQLPESIILDPKGIMVRKIAGDANWPSPKMAQFFVGLEP